MSNASVAQQAAPIIQNAHGPTVLRANTVVWLPLKEEAGMGTKVHKGQEERGAYLAATSPSDTAAKASSLPLKAEHIDPVVSLLLSPASSSSLLHSLQSGKFIFVGGVEKPWTVCMHVRVDGVISAAVLQTPLVACFSLSSQCTRWILHSSYLWSWRSCWVCSLIWELRKEWNLVSDHLLLHKILPPLKNDLSAVCGAPPNCQMLETFFRLCRPFRPRTLRKKISIAFTLLQNMHTLHWNSEREIDK